MADETNYVHEEVKKSSAAQFFAKRWVRISGIALVAAIALVGAFGAGVVAGERLGGGGNLSFGDDHGFNQQFGGNGGFPGGPGGCPANDPDHCAGKDRGQHNFQLPNSGTTKP